MKISDVERGEASTLELRPNEDDGFGQAVAPLSEASIFSSELSDAVILRIGDSTWDVRGVDDRNQDSLARIAVRNLPKMAWVASSLPRGSSNPQSLVIEVREFPSENIWPGTVDLGVDEKTVDAMRQKRKSLVSIGDVIAWLTDKLLISDSGGSNRVLLSGSPTPQVDKRSGFRLYGKGVAVDVVRDTDDRLVVTRVVEARRAATNDERRPVLLVRGQFRFTDYTIAGRFRGTARNQLDQLVEDAGSYLSLWREYNQIERGSILRRAREFGWLRYSGRRPLPDGRWRFSLQTADELEQSIRLLEDNESVDLEAAVRPPAELSEANGALADDDADRRGRVFAGECVGFDRHHATVDLRPPPGRGEDDVQPPESGVLFVSLSGDRKRLERREKAQSLIASAECPMPQLGLLIEGKVVPERRRKQEKPLSSAAREAFGGEPTARQIEALKVALNTPDIALIQGPPGTGKTRTIAALQSRLSEIAEDTEGVAGRSLLTSYQHDAVENVASATQVFGLPAIKVGRKRGQTEDADGFERWRRDRVDAVSAQLAQVQETPVAVALRRCRDLAVGYLQAPSRTEDVGALIDNIRDIAGAHLPGALADRLLELRQKASRGGQDASGDDPERELALKAARGLRVDAVAFSDDGPTQALKALRRLERLGVLNDQQRALLRRAADWDEERSPSFVDELAKLQSELIDALLPDERPANAPVINADVEAALGEVIDALNERVRSTKGGADSVLYEYRDDLEYDRRGAREAVERYTVVLAATCQQAVGYQMSLQKGDDVVFETVVVDEAARANPLDLFIPMSLAERRIILVGDHRQLPHILEHEIERDLDKNLNEKTEDMLRKSLFERLFTAMRERERADGIKRTVTLDIQYRMHPVLGDFVSDTFYRPHGEAFESGRVPEEFAHEVSGYGGAVAAWVDIPLGRGREGGRQSKKRSAEAKWIAGEVHRILDERPDYSVGVITFYSAQVDELMRQMEGHGLTEQAEDGSLHIAERWRETRDQSGRLKERLRVGTVDAFQGKEFDVVLLSMTRSNDVDAKDEKTLRRKYGHLMLENRLCVAMSRQQRLLIVVGDAGMLRPDAAADVIPGLIRFHELCGGEHGVQLHA